MEDPAQSLPTPTPPSYFLGQGDDGQRELALELEGLLDAAGGSARGNYTAERFREREPKRYALIVSGLAQGYSKQALARAIGVAWETVRAVEKVEASKSILEEKKGFADGLADVIELGIDGLKVKARDGKLSALDVAVLTDKFLVLRGEASSIVESRGEDPAVAAYREFMRQMGLQAADVFAKGGAGAAVRVVGGEVVEIEGAGGMQPLAQGSETPVNQA
jgi:hypothetical protein